MLRRRSLHLLAATLALASCGSVQDRGSTPMISGGHIEIQIRNTRLWTAGHANAYFAEQRALGLDTPLRLIEVVSPRPARDSEITIRFAVDTDGRVMDAKVLHAVTNLGDEWMIANTLNALRQWRFEPPISGGKRTGFCCVQVTYENITGF
ncbi:MAG TPA: TonB family protein [Burkholderiaceae bacterium]|nr:TonB family protein [Burkholderiaceae bacterium]